MSRCFPFPSPGYVRNGIRDEELVESIKREEEKAKRERKKERKRGKKEKKKKARGAGESEIKKLNHKRRHKDDGTKEDLKAKDNHKRKVIETELLEKSSLTEEHGQLIGSQNSCDSTLNSNKSQKQSPSPPPPLPLPLPPSDDCRLYNYSESIIRIRLPVKRQKDPQVLTSKEQQPCSSQGRIDDDNASQPAASTPSKEWVVQQHPCSNSSDMAPEQHPISFSEENGAHLNRSSKQLNLKLSKERLSKEKLHPLFDSSKPLASRKPDMVQPSDICGICPPSVAAQFRELVENWVPSSVQKVIMETSNGDDRDWLLRSKSPITGANRCETSRGDMNQGNPTTWPSACFLPEADVYALPFTVPF